MADAGFGAGVIDNRGVVGMKTCFKCKRELPRSEFYAHPMMADGLLGKCKDCTRNDATSHRLRNIDRVRGYDRSRADQPHRAELRTRICQEDRRLYPERYKARAAVGYAIRAGRLIRPTNCQRCGCRPSRVEAHHHDYLLPFVVEWLCKPCHYKADQERITDQETTTVVTVAQQGLTG